MIPWREIASKISALDPDLKSTFGFADSALPAENVKKLVQAVPELASEIDTSDLEDSIRKFRAAQVDAGEAAALGRAADDASSALGIMKTVSAPGLEAVSAAGRAAGLLGPEETPGDAVKAKVGGGLLGSAAAGAADVIVDPISWAGGAVAKAAGMGPRVLAAMGAMGLAKGASGALGRSVAAGGSGDSSAAQEDAVRLAASVAASMAFPLGGAAGGARRVRVPEVVVPEVVREAVPPTAIPPRVASPPSTPRVVQPPAAPVSPAPTAPVARPQPLSPLEGLLERPRTADRLPREWREWIDLVPQKPTEMVFNGSGRATKEEIYRDLAGPIAGPGRYWAFREDHARAFGPNIESAPIESVVKNPLVINTDDQWKRLTKTAGWEFPNPIGSDPVEFTKKAQALQDLVKSMGHDGIVVRFDPDGPDGETKTLMRVFDIPQVISFSDAAKPAATAATRETPQSAKVASVLKAIDKATAPPPAPPTAASSLQKHVAKAEAELSRIEAERPRKNAKKGAFEEWDARRAAAQAKVEQMREVGDTEIEWAGMVAQKLKKEGFVPKKGDDLMEFIRSYATNDELRNIGLDPRPGNPNKAKPGRPSLMERLVEMEGEDSGRALDYGEQSQFENEIIAKINAAQGGPVWSRAALDRGAGNEIRKAVQESGIRSVESFVATTDKLSKGKPVTAKQMESWVAAVKAIKSSSIDVNGDNFESYRAAREEYMAAKEADLSNLDEGYRSEKPARPSRAGAPPRISPEEAARRAGLEAPPSFDGPDMVIDYSEPPAAPPVDTTMPDRSKGVSFGKAPAAVERPNADVDRPLPSGTLAKVASVARSVPDTLRQSLRTVRSELVAKGYPNVAQVLFRAGAHADAQATKASVVVDRLRAMGVWDKDNLDIIGRIIEEGPRREDSEKHLRAAEILSKGFGEQYDTAARKDPLRGDPETETLAGVAPRVRKYFPRTNPEKDVPEFIASNEKFRPLTTTSRHMSPNIYSERLPASNSVRVTDPVQLEAILMEGAKTSGALVGGANAERTPANYPNFFKAAYEQRRRQTASQDMTEAARHADAFSVAKARVEMEQLPDVWEAAARDRPGVSLDDLAKNPIIARAADMVIRNRSGLTSSAKATIDAATGLAAGLQLGHAAPLNAAGLVYPALWASKMGANPMQALGASIKAAALAAKYGAEDVGMMAGRKLGLTDELSASQLAFGMSRSLNPFRRAIAFADRNTRLAVAEAMKPYIAKMPHAWFRTTDHSLPMNDPRNIEIAARELANASQGLGSRADKLKDGSNQFWNVVRHIASQYSSPEIRQLEQNGDRMSWQGAALAAIAGVVIGEGINDARSLSRGTGVNLPGSEPTEDQKRKSVGATLLSPDRDPRIPQRIAQNLLTVVPGSKTVLNGMEYGDAPGVGVILGTAAPAAGAVSKIAQAVNQYRKTGDAREFLSIVEAPGLGREWAKIIAFEQARKDAKSPAPETGYGRVSQNMGWPWKIDLYLKGKITRDQLINDTMVGGKGLPMEQKARAYRKEQNDRKDREDKRKQEKRGK